MRLINVAVFLEFEQAGKVPPDAKLLVEINSPALEETRFAILSHCWGDPKDEVQYTEIEELTTDDAARNKIRQRSGYIKILKSCKRAFEDELLWLWVDTCCIDKRSSAELTEAINSMYAWYENSDRCYVLLHDLDDQVLPTQPDQNFSEFNGWPKWFSRGWTLQELIAPAHVQFFNRHWEVVGNKKVNSDALSVITGISTDVLVKGLGSSNPSVAQILSWAANRSTTREEDRAYSLLGLFGVHMPMLYGEGKGAFLRLQLEIIRMTNDQSIFAWCWTGRKDTGRSGSFLADDPSYFHDCSNIHRMHHDDLLDALHKPLLPAKGDSPGIAGSQEERLQTFMVTNYGIQIWLHLQSDSSSRGQELYSVMLACRKTGEDSPIVITMRRSGSNYSRYFYRRPADWDDKAPTEFKQLFLPYRDKVVNNLNVRNPQAKQCWMPQILLTDIVPSDIVIVVLGASRSGKTSIIKNLIRTSAEKDGPTVSTTTVVAYARISQGKRYVFIDTPAFELQAYEVIFGKLHQIYQKSIKLTGVIYTHSLEAGFPQASERNIQILANMCGEGAISRLRLMTTMWDAVDFSVALEVERKLKLCYEAFVKAGPVYQCFKQESAWAIVHDLGYQQEALLLQKEMEERRDLWKTSALRGITPPREM